MQFLFIHLILIIKIYIKSVQIKITKILKYIQIERHLKVTFGVFIFSIFIVFIIILLRCLNNVLTEGARGSNILL